MKRAAREHARYMESLLTGWAISYDQSPLCDLDLGKVVKPGRCSLWYRKHVKLETFVILRILAKLRISKLVVCCFEMNKYSPNFSPFFFLSFRLILAMDPRYGEISRAMRNRGVEIFMLGEVGFNIAAYIVSCTSEIIGTW